jgi:sugar (pentulose or hexulose) kinase
VGDAGTVLLDAEGHVLRPCIFWNDVRAVLECRELERAFSIRTWSPQRADKTQPLLGRNDSARLT